METVAFPALSAEVVPAAKASPLDPLQVTGTPAVDTALSIRATAAVQLTPAPAATYCTGLAGVTLRIRSCEANVAVWVPACAVATSVTLPPPAVVTAVLAVPVASVTTEQ